jgi:hypothetical protein
MDPNDFLMGGGVKSAAFPTIGTTVSGRIVRAPEVRQQTTPEGQAKTFDNGDPMMQLIVQLATDERDPQDREDDGTRALYVKSNMLNAVRDAVRKTGAKGLEVGGTLIVQYIGDGDKKRAAHSAPKLYAASYTPPVPQAAADFLMGQPAPTAAPVQPPQQYAPQPAAPPAPVGAPPTGIDPALWTQLSTEQRASVLAASANVR